MNTENVVETVDDAKSIKAGLANVSFGLARGTGKLIGDSYRMASRFSKTVKQYGKKIAGVQPHADAAEDPYAQLAEPTGEDADGRSQVDFKPSIALDPGAEEATSSKRAMRMLVTTLESDLKAVRGELEEMRSQAKGTNTPLTSQLTALQEERESLLADLAHARIQADEMTAGKDALSEEVTALQSELVATKTGLQKVHNLADQIQDELKLQLDVLQTKNESLMADLEGAQDKLYKIKSFEQQFTEIDQSETDNITPVAEDEPEEIEEPPPQASVTEEVVETETAPAQVTAEEVNAAVFDSATEKVIFIKALSDLASQDELTHIDAVKAIGGIRHELSVRALVAHIRIEPAAQVRHECIKALAVLNVTEGLPAVKRALKDKAGLVRLAAVWSLYRLAGAESGPALTRMFADEDDGVRRRATACIGWLGKEEFATSLIPLLDDSSVSVRQAAIEAMGNLHNPAVVSALFEHLNNPEKTIREAIIAALKTITGRKMSETMPKDDKSAQQLIARWRQWWGEQYPG